MTHEVYGIAEIFLSVASAHDLSVMAQGAKFWQQWNMESTNKLMTPKQLKRFLPLSPSVFRASLRVMTSIAAMGKRKTKETHSLQYL